MSCVSSTLLLLLFFFFNDAATTEIYTLSLHDALPTCSTASRPSRRPRSRPRSRYDGPRSEEHTSELQSRQYLVCRLLLEKKKNRTNPFRKTDIIPQLFKCANMRLVRNKDRTMYTSPCS